MEKEKFNFRVSNSKWNLNVLRSRVSNSKYDAILHNLILWLDLETREFWTSMLLCQRILKTKDTVQQKNKLKIRFNQVHNNFIEKELSSNQWLSDETINLTKVLLHKKFPVSNGFEDTTLGNLRLFSVQKITLFKLFMITITGYIFWLSCREVQHLPLSFFTKIRIK